MAPQITAAGFRHWRRTRPFWGGLLLVLAGVEMFLSANQSLGDLEVHFGPQGFLSYLLPALLVLCGVLSWASPAQRLFYGILALLTAVYSLVGLNFGGFVLGMLSGIVGGALVLAWSPPRTAGPAPAVVAAPPATADPAPGPVPAPGQPPGAAGIGSAETVYLDSEIVPGFDPDRQETGPSLRETGPPLREAGPSLRETGPDDTQALPIEPAAPQPPSPSGGNGRKALVITLAPLMVGAIVVAGGRVPARAAAECPAGLPSRSAATSVAPSSAAPGSSPPRVRVSSATPPAAATPGRSAAQPSGSPARPRSSSAQPARSSARAGSSASSGGGAEEGDDPLRDAGKDITGGVGDLLDPVLPDGPAASAPAAPSGSASASGPAGGGSPSSSVAPSRTAASALPVSPSATSSPGVSHSPGGSGSPGVSASPTGRVSAGSPSATGASLDEIPCLGPRVIKEGDAGGAPAVSVRGGTLETASLTMYNSTYEGVVPLDTADGTLRALRFDMDKAVNKPFRLSIPEAGGRTTLIESDELTTDGNVSIYTPRFAGKLFGVIPVTFTPEQPPPLTLPVLWFTDVTIQLAFVACDTLTALPLGLSES